MVIKVLVENRSSSTDFACEHGLSLYVETQKHKILFDMGASTSFLENAKKMDCPQKKEQSTVSTDLDT